MNNKFEKGYKNYKYYDASDARQDINLFGVGVAGPAAYFCKYKYAGAKS